MPRYFFDADDGRGKVDRSGQDYPNDTEALRHAAVIASEVLRSPAMQPEDGGAVVVTVSDEDRKPKAEFRLVYDVKWVNLPMLLAVSAPAALLEYTDCLV